MKNIVLTLDYELFFGTKAGSVENCMIKPIDLLVELFDKYDCKMTIFWDVLHYIKAKELNIIDEMSQIEKSIEKLVSHGHDVQLHIHSHWVDAKYENDKWIFPTYEHYNLQTFEKTKILDIVTKSKEVIENITKQKVTTFRAGGWQIEPFEDLRDAFLKNEIFIDSSVAFDKVQKNKIISFDFRDYPNDEVYTFDNTPKVKVKNGKFIEYQIKNIKIPNYIIFYSYLKKFFFKENYPILGDGIGAGGMYQSKFSTYKLLLNRVLWGSKDMLSLEFTSKLVFEYMLKITTNNSIMIGHPKSIGYKHIEILEEILKSKRIKFISLKEILDS